ncbi:MAG TPA: glycosyltransferase family 4 protein [Rhodanobacteraceae bacterium]|jgi:glycosyltransferase involved in cell wall biosynthesis|nr:glycosyltransferase family 4 protein [Rhodanobacteraceae bacterium]
MIAIPSISVPGHGSQGAMKLVLVVPSLGGGGAERVMATLANAWAVRGNEVTLITLSSAVNDRYPLDRRVWRVALDVARRSSNPAQALGRNVVRIRALRRAIKAARPDAVISFVSNTNALVMIAATGLRVPVIVTERQFIGAEPSRLVWTLLRRLLYRRAAAVVAQTRRCADELELRVGRAVKVIPNPVAPASGKSTPDAVAAAEGRVRTLLAVGRLVPAKGFDLLIDAFARVAQRHPGWKLEILGEGPLRETLTQAIAMHDLAGRIAMPGFSTQVRQAMRRADLFVLSSRFEGLPNALLEAMAEGVACVSFDCTAGPRELIAHGENGWLVPAEDVDGLATALDTLMQDDVMRARLGMRAREVCSLYSVSEILRQWDMLLASVTAANADCASAAAERA